MELPAAMQVKGKKPNAIAYSTTTNAGEKARQPHKVMGLLSEMQQKCRAPNFIAA